MRTIFICGIDAVKHKNLHQIRGLQARGYRFVVLTTDSTGKSREVLGKDVNTLLFIPNKKCVVFSMIAQALYIIWRYRPAIVEIYPYSHFAFVMAFILKVVGVKTLIVARGEELKYVNKSMPLIQRVFFRATYALAGGVVYKELYMPEMLDEMRKRVRWHMPNAIKLPSTVSRSVKKGCTFLYMNTMKPFRHPEICLEAFMAMCEKYNLKGSSDIRLIIVGISGTVSSPETHEKERRLMDRIEGCDVPVELHNWTNYPSQYLQMADVFLLPADIVYVNYTLLEAMGCGIPVIIQNAPGAEKLLTHGCEGYIEGVSPEAWEKRMSTLAEDAELRVKMGRAAREKIARDFNYETHIRRYSEIYNYCINKGEICPSEYL